MGGLSVLAGELQRRAGKRWLTPRRSRKPPKSPSAWGRQRHEQPPCRRAAIGEFEGRAIESAADHGGRVVKTIGDEVMFVAPDVLGGFDDPVAAYELERA